LQASFRPGLAVAKDFNFKSMETASQGF
jgi:hypothetical protein